MRRRRALILAIGCASTLLAVGCGGDDAPIEPISTSSTSAGSGGISEQEFVASGDSLCAEANVAIANLSSGTAPSPTAASQELEITQGVQSGLQGLGSPSDPDGSLASFYGALKDEVRILGQKEQAVSGGDTASAASLDTELDAARSDAQQAASQYGFEECGQQGAALPSTPSGGATPDPAAPSTPAIPDPAAPDPATPPAPAPAAPVTPDPSGGSGGGTPAPAPTPAPPSPTPAPPAPGGGGSSGSGGVGPG